VTKALGTGIRGLTLDQIVVTKNGVGKPGVQLRDDALRMSQDQGWVSCDVSVAHSVHSACAVVVALREESGERED
jgi:phosphopantetheinyl transferase (holo-ACP synthase)